MITVVVAISPNGRGLVRWGVPLAYTKGRRALGIVYGKGVISHGVMLKKELTE